MYRDGLIVHMAMDYYYYHGEHFMLIMVLVIVVHRATVAIAMASKLAVHIYSMFTISLVSHETLPYTVAPKTLSR